MSNLNNERDSFSGKFGVIAAAAGSAIGLGNIWRFPYVVGENGGAAFLIVNLAFILAIGVPVMLSELLIGRKAQLNIFGAFKKLAPGSPWFLVGLMGVGAAFMILSFYAVVAGWTLEYTFFALKNEFAGKSPEQLQAVFNELTTPSFTPVIFILLFMALSAFIVQAGIKNGIEKYAKILMPMLLIIIVGLAIRAITLEGASAGLLFLFKPDFSKITTQVLMEALGQAFFSLSLGMGVMATYGSYIKKNQSLGQTAITVALTDTFIAILAGVAIFPAVFAFGIAPDQGAGLVFITLPGIFNQMFGGYVFALLFFVLLVIAALTSAISLLEVAVAYFVEQLKIKRQKATWIVTAIISGLAILCAFSESTFTFFDKTSSNVLLPLGGLLIVVFVGWFIGKAAVRKELEEDGRVAFYFKLFIPVIRFVAPIAIAMVFLNRLGFLKF